MKTIDLLVTARRIYAVDQTFSIVEAMAVDADESSPWAGARSSSRPSGSAEEWIWQDAYVYPGFMDPTAIS